MRVPGFSARNFGSNVCMIDGVGRDHRRLAEIGFEQIADDERDAIGDFGFIGDAPGQLDEPGGRLGFVRERSRPRSKQSLWQRGQLHAPPASAQGYPISEQPRSGRSSTSLRV